MPKKLSLTWGLLGFLAAGMAAAQTTTTVTGTIKDLAGNVVTSGQVTFDLRPGADTTISGSGRFVPTTITCQINASGQLVASSGSGSCVVTQNTALTPAGTYYLVTLWPSFVAASRFNWYAVGSSQDITTVVPTPATLPAYTFMDLASSQTVAGAKSFTGAVTLSAVSASSPSISPTNIGSVVYADGFSGADLGARLNAAEASASPGATITWHCNGDTTVNTQVVITKPIQLVGCDRAGRLIPGSGLAGKPMINVYSGAGSAQFTPFGDAVGITLSHLWIEDTAERSFQTDGIMLNWVKHVHLHDITVEALNGYALKLSDPSAPSIGPVSESSFDNLHLFWDGDPTDGLPALDIYTAATSGDENNDLYFSDSQITESYYWAIRIGTGNSGAGPRLIWFNGVQVEGLEELPTQTGTITPTIAAPYDGVEIQQAGSVFFNGLQVTNSGQGKMDVNLVGSSADPVANASVMNGVYGGQVCLTGTVNTSGTAVTWASGDKFVTGATGFWNGLTFTIASTGYTVSSVSGTTSLTLTTSAGTQTGAAYSICSEGSGSYGVQKQYVTDLTIAGNAWLGQNGGNFSNTQTAVGSVVDLSDSVEAVNSAGGLPALNVNRSLNTRFSTGQAHMWSLGAPGYTGDSTFALNCTQIGVNLVYDNGYSCLVQSRDGGTGKMYIGVAAPGTGGANASATENLQFNKNGDGGALVSGPFSWGAGAAQISSSTSLLVGVGAVTTSAGASDSVSLTWPDGGSRTPGHCAVTPSDASASTNIASTYVSAKSANAITLTHAGVSGMTYDVICSVN